MADWSKDFDSPNEQRLSLECDRLRSDLARVTAELRACNDDFVRGMKIANDVTPETQTVEECCAELVRIVARVTAERDEAKAEIPRLRACINAMATVRPLDGNDDGVLDAFLGKLEDDVQWMTREDAVAHYTTAIANWGLCLDWRDRLTAELTAARAAQTRVWFIGTDGDVRICFDCGDGSVDEWVIDQSEHRFIGYALDAWTRITQAAFAGKVGEVAEMLRMGWGIE